jgi:CRP-like cAMP-binding protein
MNIKKKIKSWLGITALEMEIDHLRGVINTEQKRIARRIEELDNLTREDIDIGFRGKNTIILTGVYRGRGYVEFYDMSDYDFAEVVKMYQDRRKRNLLRVVDGPPFVSGAFDIR